MCHFLRRVFDGGKVVGVQRREYVQLERVGEVVKKVVDDTHCESVASPPC